MRSEPRLLPPFKTASYLVRAFYDLGLRNVVISPGSRSTPLTLAFAHHPGFNKQVVLDERSAAFIALGMGKSTGKPAILVCTSGTAAANYHPAVAEAKESGVPMIICTADRPPALRGIGSSQTLDQIKLYGDSAVWFHEVGEPADTPRDHSRLTYAARQAMDESIHSGGAAHLNIPFRKPLEPGQSDINTEKERFAAQFEDGGAGQSDSDTASKRISIPERLTSLINKSERPLVIAGPTDPFRCQQSEAVKIAGLLQAPLLAEPGSGIKPEDIRIDHFEQLLRNPATLKNLSPDLILRFGDQPYTVSLLKALNRWRDVPLIQFSNRQFWQDHEMSVDHRIILEKGDLLNLESISPREQGPYLDSWLEADNASHSLLVQAVNETDTLCDGHIFRHTMEQLSSTWNVMYSNSLPVRDAALFGYPAGDIFLNRGVAGIDGVMSTAIGTALATRQPTCCLIGDLAFLHDSNAMLSISSVDTPFVVIVINNDGGNIFRMLPIQEHDDVYNKYFETPQRANIQDLAKAHSLGYHRIETLSALRHLQISEALTSDGPVIIECITDPDDSMALRRRLWEG